MNIRISKKVIDSVKKIYPDLNGGFVYFETKPDGSPWENPIDGLFWESQEYAKPDWQTIEDNFLDDIVYKKEELLILINQKKLQARDKGLEITVDGITYLANKENVIWFFILKEINGYKPFSLQDKNGKPHILDEQKQKNLAHAIQNILIGSDKIAVSVENTIHSLTKENIDQFNLDEAWKEAIKNVIK